VVLIGEIFSAIFATVLFFTFGIMLLVSIFGLIGNVLLCHIFEFKTLKIIKQVVAGRFFHLSVMHPHVPKRVCAGNIPPDLKIVKVCCLFETIHDPMISCLYATERHSGTLFVGVLQSIAFRLGIRTDYVHGVVLLHTFILMNATGNERMYLHYDLFEHNYNNLYARTVRRGLAFDPCISDVDRTVRTMHKDYLSAQRRKKKNQV